MRSYIIGSFNLYKMDFKSNEETKKDFNQIAHIIREEQFDVIALQEVLSESAVKQIVCALNSNCWDYHFQAGSITASKNAQREGYAFIWNKRRLRLVDGQDAISVKEEYRIRRRWMGKYVHRGSLVRPPLVIRLTPQGVRGGANFELRLINTHIAFQVPQACVEHGKRDEVIRKRELKVLAEQVYYRVSTKRYGNNLPAYTVLLGDYNLCLAGVGVPLISEYIDITANRQLRTVQQEQTTLKQTQSSYRTTDLTLERDTDVIQKGETNYFSQNYDHFSYEKVLDDTLTLTASRVNVVDKYGLEAYRQHISDHVPIKLVMNFTTKKREESKWNFPWNNKSRVRVKLMHRFDFTNYRL